MLLARVQLLPVVLRYALNERARRAALRTPDLQQAARVPLRGTKGFRLYVGDERSTPSSGTALRAQRASTREILGRGLGTSLVSKSERAGFDPSATCHAASGGLTSGSYPLR